MCHLARRSVLDPQSLGFVNLETSKFPKHFLQEAKGLSTMCSEELRGEYIKEYSENSELWEEVSPLRYSNRLWKNTITFQSGNGPK